MSFPNMTETECKARYRQVRAGFIANGTTLTEWCRANGTHIQNVRDAFFGRWNGPGAKKMVVRDARATDPVGL